jgi:hypothetical protein
MDCLSTAIEKFMIYHCINPIYSESIATYLKNSNYTIYTRTQSLYIGEHISGKHITKIQDIQPYSIIGIYVKPNEYLNVFGYHYFYVDYDSIVSSWYTSRNITPQEYDQLEYKERSLSETSIENGNIDQTVLDLNVLNQLWELIHNQDDDIGYDLYQLFGGTDLINMNLKKSENKILLYMFNIV